MTNEEIRSEFKKFVGNEKYKHFILTIYEAFPLRKRLFFWQEQLLKDFTNEFDLEIIEFSKIHKIFNSPDIFLPSWGIKYLHGGFVGPKAI